MKPKHILFNPASPFFLHRLLESFSGRIQRHFLLLVLFFPVASLSAQEPDTSYLSLIFAGDIMGHDAQINGAWNSAHHAYNYDPSFMYVSDYLKHADIAIANFEVTLAGPPFKGYPEFSSPDALAEAAKAAGFDVFIQANNHALDRGKPGFGRTLKVLDSLEIIHTGTFADKSSRQRFYPLILEKNGIRIALLNYTYGTNGLVIPEPFVINRIDTLQIRNDLEKAKSARPDFIIVTMHWGNEYERNENLNQRELARYILYCGANAIIGSHPHVIQPIKLYRERDSSRFNIVVYSLGNFVSNQRSQYRDGGILFEIVLEKTCDSTRVRDYSYLPYWVYREDMTERSNFFVVPVPFFEKNESLFHLKEYDRYKLMRFADDTRLHLEGIPETTFYDSFSGKE